MNSKYSPLAICKNLINFITSKIFPPTTSSRDSEIVIEFRHNDDSGNRPRIDDRNCSEKTEKQQNDSITNSDDRKIGKRPKKSVTIKEDERTKRKEANALAHDHEDNTKPKPPRHWGPLLSVASNINEKCEAFISSRKRAMRRNYTLDPAEKS